MHQFWEWGPSRARTHELCQILAEWHVSIYECFRERLIGFGQGSSVFLVVNLIQSRVSISVIKCPPVSTLHACMALLCAQAIPSLKPGQMVSSCPGLMSITRKVSEGQLEKCWNCQLETGMRKLQGELRGKEKRERNEGCGAV